MHFSGKFTVKKQTFADRTVTFYANKQVRAFPQAQNAIFWLDEMAKIWFLQIHTLPWLRRSDKDSASGIKMASEGTGETDTRDRKWAKSEKNRCGLQLAEKLPESPGSHSSYWAKTARSSLLTGSTLSNRNCSQQVKYYILFSWCLSSILKPLLYLEWKLLFTI